MSDVPLRQAEGGTPSADGTSPFERGASNAPHRTRVPDADELDMRRTTSWAIAPVASGGATALGFAVFDLLNLETGRAHMLYAPTIGLNVGIPARLGRRTVHLPSGSAGTPSYLAFETSRPMTFADFDGLYFRFTQASIGLIYGYSRSYLTLWEDNWYFGDQVAYIRGMDGWGIVFLPAGSVGHGRTTLSRGSGTPQGPVNVPLILVPDDDDDYLPEPLAWVRTEAREGPLIRLPADALFDFDSARLRKDAIPVLTYTGDLLNNRRTERVIIEGHTDSIGRPEYNCELSLRRAQSVKAWLVAKRIDRAGKFVVRGLGESQPVAPNRNPDGSDNPEGRQQNRRVAVQADWNFPR